MIELHTYYPSPDKYETEFDKNFFLAIIRDFDLEDVALIKIGELAKAHVGWEEGLLGIMWNIQNHRNFNQKVLEQVFPIPFVELIVFRKSLYLRNLLIEKYQEYHVGILEMRRVLEGA